MVIVREQELIRSLERGSVLLIAQCVRERKKISSLTLMQNVPRVMAAEETHVISCPIHFVKEKGLFLNTKQMSMQNLIDFTIVQLFTVEQCSQ